MGAQRVHADLRRLPAARRARADGLGRRRLFMAGIAVFAGASLLCGVSQSEGMLLVARGLQGLGGAMVSPAALSIILTTFAEGTRAQPRARRLGRDRGRRRRGRAAARRRDRAGAQLALGVLHQRSDRRASVLALAPRIVPESRAGRRPRRLRRRGRGRHHARHDGARLHADQGRRAGAGRRGGRSRASRSAAVLLAAFVCHRAPAREPAGPAAHLLQPQPRGLGRDDARGRRRAVRRVLLLHAVPAAGARLQRAEDRRRLPAAGR